MLRSGTAVTDNRIDLVLARVLASRFFVRSQNMKRLLRFLVAEAKEGRGSQLKAVEIGMRALGRGPRFDPNIDPIVRVECARLRRLLALYAETEGADDAFAFELPRGNYGITFVPMTERQA